MRLFCCFLNGQQAWSFIQPARLAPTLRILTTRARQERDYDAWRTSVDVFSCMPSGVERCRRMALSVPRVLEPHIAAPKGEDAALDRPSPAMLLHEVSSPDFST
jgi:hypothetical protein